MLAGRLGTRLTLIVVVGMTAGLLGLPSVLSRGAPGSTEDPPSSTSVEDAYAKLPMSFVPNRGQLPVGIGYGAQGNGYSLGLGPAEAVFVLSRAAQGRPSDGVPSGPLAARGLSDRAPREHALVRMQLLGADPAARSDVDVPLLGTANYLVGDDPGRWQSGIPTFAKVTYRAVYPGVDVSYHGDQGQFEYDFVVAPGIDPAVVDLGFSGAQEVRLADNGDLVLAVPGGELRQHAPFIYQDGVDGREPVSGGFVVRGDGRVGFTAGPYDRSRPLVIDPRLDYSTFIGTAGFDAGYSVAVDNEGDAYVAGTTTSPNFPTTPGAYDTSFNGDQDAFVAKLNEDGSALVYSTFIGGSGLDDADSVAVDVRGAAYFRGVTVSPDFPTTRRAFDRTFNGGFDAYVAKLSPDGSTLGYSTFLGGANFDSGSGIAVDRRGAAYVSGITGSPEFPTTPGAFQTTFHGVGGPLPPPVGPGDFDAFLTKFEPDGSSLAYSTFLGGSQLDVGFEVAVDPREEAYVTGLTMSPDFPTTPGAHDSTLGGFLDAYVAKFNRNGTALEYSTYLGGSAPDGALGLAVDLRGSAYVSGATPSPDFPTTPGAFDQTSNGANDIFLTKLRPDGSGLAYSTFVGGAGSDGASAVTVNVLGEAYVTGSTTSLDFPTTAGALAATLSGDQDAYLTKLTRDGTGLAYSSYLGGSEFDLGQDVSVDRRGNAYVSGDTYSPDFPTTAGAFDRTFNGDSDAFVSKFSGL